MLNYELTKQSLDRITVTIRIAVIIFVVEAIIMFIFAVTDYEINAYLEAVIDISSLIVISTPLIYMWVISPYIKAKNDALEVLNQLAHTDLLTSIPNRRDIYNQLERSVAVSSRHNLLAAVIMLDLDGFKQINDNFGHEAGDAVLIETAHRLKSKTRPLNNAVRFTNLGIVLAFYQ